MKTDFHNPLFIMDFWGKARASNQAGSSTHSIIYHSLDVAAVGAELTALDQDRLRRLATATGIDFGQLTSVLPFLLSLHDIGKYARVFQAKSPDHWPTALGPLYVADCSANNTFARLKSRGRLKPKQIVVAAMRIPRHRTDDRQ